MQSDRLIHDTGRVGRWVCLPISVFGLLGLIGGIVNVRSSPSHALPPALLGLLMLSIWFWRTRIYYAANRNEIVIRGSSAFWGTQHISLMEAKAIHLRNIPSRRYAGADISIVFRNGNERWLTRVAPGDPDHVASAFAEAISLPVIS